MKKKMLLMHWKSIKLNQAVQCYDYHYDNDMAGLFVWIVVEKMMNRLNMVDTCLRL